MREKYESVEMLFDKTKWIIKIGANLWEQLQIDTVGILWSGINLHKLLSLSVIQSFVVLCFDTKRFQLTKSDEP